MHKLKILVLEQSEITTIADACRFLAVPSDISIEVHSLSEQLSGLDLPRLNPIPAANMKSLCRSFYSSSAKPSALVKEILFFSSLAVHKQLAEFQKQQSPTLYIHPDLAIMELSAPLTLHQAFPDWAHAIRPSTPTHQHALTPTQHFVDNAVEPCILAGDSAHGFLPEGFCPTVYPEISAYLKAKVPNQVLLTANHHLIMALLAMDEENWSIFHPECCVRNLALDVCSNPQSSALYGLNQAIRQLSRLVSTPTSAFDFAGIRHAKQADKHAYSFFARHYDEYMAHVDYELWITRILIWQKQYSTLQLKRVLELACGTANVSNRLVHKGYAVDACDLSAEMLIVAESKAMKPHLYQASLIDEIPQKGYDLILCMFDSVNYLTKASELSTMLTQVHRALADNGLYIFDVSTFANSEENFEDICSMTRTRNGYLVHQAWFEALHMKQKSSLNYFRKELIGFSHHYEQHQQQVYMCHELIELINNSPLKLLAIHSTESSMNFYPKHLNGIDNKYFRLFFVLRKEP